MTTILQTQPFTKKAVSQAGARIAVDPKDGNLFVAVGDRSTGDPVPMQAQQQDTHLGKIVHITPDGEPDRRATAENGKRIKNTSGVYYNDEYVRRGKA